MEKANADGVPRAFGFDEQGRQMLTYLVGEVIGETEPWPAWVYADSTLVQVGRWTASTSSREFDLAFSALLWVPLTPPDAGEQQDSHDVSCLSRRFHLLLDAYRYEGDRPAFGSVVAQRARRQAKVIRSMADAGDRAAIALVPIASLLDQSASYVEELHGDFWTP